MTEATPTRKEWQKLYKAAIRFKEVAPWQWMSEDDMFGVQNPKTGELGFVSIMGALGEHLSLALYKGAKGLYEYLDFRRVVSMVDPEMLLTVPHLQASFENRDQLDKKDRAVIKELGLKFRGRQAWPFFRSFRPGYFPWFLEPEEARFLSCALEQAVEVSMRFKEDPSLLDVGDKEDYLVRVPQKKKKRLVWEEEVMQVPPPEPAMISVSIDGELLEYVEDLPQGPYLLELDLSIFPAPVGPRDIRPSMPYILLMAEGKSGMILSHGMIEIEEGIEELWGMIPEKIVLLCARLEATPRQIRVRSLPLFQTLFPLSEKLDFELKAVKELPAVDQAKAVLLQGLF